KPSRPRTARTPPTDSAVRTWRPRAGRWRSIAAGVSDPAAVLGGRAGLRGSKVGRCGQQGDVAERLGEVPHQPAGTDVVLLAEEAHVVPQGKQSLEELERLVAATDERPGVGQPEGAGEECALAGRQAVHSRLRRVTEDDALTQQLALDRL